MTDKMRLALWIFSALFLPLPAFAQAEWTAADCAQAGLAMGAGGACFERRTDAKSVQGSVIGYRQHYRFERDAGGVREWWHIQHSARGGQAANRFKPSTPADSERTLRGMVGGASNWSAYKGFGDTGYMTFTRRGASCVAVDHGGDGYAWLLRGYHCQSTPITDGEALAKALLGAIRIGPASSTVNALGSTVKPLN